jgi:ubiquinone/menaquinone biosynthesis C-methylase UbiE
VRDYYEELWERLPDDLEPPDVALRRRFAMSNVTAGERVLDLGCGEGDFAAWFNQAGCDAVGVDVAEAALARARRRHPELKLLWTPIDGPLPLPDGRFQVVWASEVIEHVADTARWLSEVRRVLKPGGRLLVTTPNHSRLGLALGGIQRYSQPLGDHLHLYAPASLRDVLRDLQFEPVRVRARGGVPLARRILTAIAAR